MNVTSDQLLQIMPSAGGMAEKYVDHLNAAMAEFDINTEKRIECFLAQIAHESSHLRTVQENLNYSAKRLMVVWKTRFPTLESAAPYANNPQALANKVYANRGGNGNEASGDGWRYRGAGLIQLTFADSHNACADHFGVPREAIGDWLRTLEGASRSAAWFWKTHGCNEMADADQFDPITRRINGGTHGAAERLAFWKEAKEAIV